MKKKYIIIITFLLLALSITIGAGVSYAFYNVNKKQDNRNVASSQCFNITFSDSGSKINYSNAIPLSDEEGMKLDKYTFTINNTCPMNAFVDVNQELLANNTMSNSLIKSVLDDNTPVLLTSSTTKTISEATSSYKIGTFLLPGNTSQTHTVGLWIDGETGTVENSNNKVISTQISVVANATTPIVGRANDYIISLAGSTQGDGEVVLENGYRYEGKDPNNYVLFNDELWRIIGVFDSETHGIENTNLVKLIRNESIGYIEWDTTKINDWSTASLQKRLNGDYYNTIATSVDNGLIKQYKNMIENVTWHLGGSSTLQQPVNSFYIFERGYTVYNARVTQWNGKIGLIYPSDYGYSVSAETCSRLTNLNDYNLSECCIKSWLYNQNDEWTISPKSSESNFAYYISSIGSVTNSVVNYNFRYRPSLYLKSNTYILSGDGTKTNPYIISM